MQREALPPRVDEPAYVEDKVHVWPYLVRLELLAVLAVTVVLTVWSIVIDAPLEEEANPTKTPNPSKAPWYFLGLQEMLVYFDPWYAGVVLPLLIILGLMAIPYVDPNPKGSGYFTFRQRWFAVSTFLFGFLVLWISLILVGVFLRGPGWNFFAPWEHWDPHKVVALTNVDLSFWLFRVDSSSTAGLSIGAGAVLLFYSPAAVFWVWGRRKGLQVLAHLGPVRYAVVAFLFMTMMTLPAKMLLRWLFNIKYVWVTPWFNF